MQTDTAPDTTTQPSAETPRAEKLTLAGSVPKPKLKFAPNNSFLIELRKRVDAYMRANGLRPHDCPATYVKSAIFLSSYVASYILLVFVVNNWVLAVPLTILAGLLAAGIGLNIQHDGGHKAYSKHAVINKLSALTLDFVGASSYIWHWKHVVFHHTYVNIDGHDTDIDFGSFARMSPYQPHRSYHRWQHIYLWPLYGFMMLRWHLFGDFRDVLAGTIGVGGPKFPRPRGWDLLTFWAGKAFFISYVFVIPMLLHPVWIVLLAYILAASVVGITMSIVFLLAHCVEEAKFLTPPESQTMDNAWAIHQAESTVDFARKNAVATWLLGGLNFQIEHHLFPNICHVNYPKITYLVEDTCHEFGVKYSAHKTIRAGLASHYHWLKKMSQP